MGTLVILQTLVERENITTETEGDVRAGKRKEMRGNEKQRNTFSCLMFGSKPQHLKIKTFFKILKRLYDLRQQH